MKVAPTPVRLSVVGLSKSFGGVQVVSEVSFEALGSHVLGIVGENGSGKSTTLNLITGVVRADSGRVLLNGTPFAPRSRAESDAAGVAFIQQELNVFPNLTVAENLFLVAPQEIYGLRPLISRRRREKRARELLVRVDLEVSPNTLAGTLSAGQRQLIEIARALAQEARVLLLDEPTTSLTAPECERLFSIIARLKSDGAAVLYVSHNLEDVLRLSDEVVVMQDGRVTLKAPRGGVSAQDLVLAMVGHPIETLFPQVSNESIKGIVPRLEVRGLTTPGVLEGIDLTVAPGEIVGVAGLMGSGRTELARAIFGLEAYESGSVAVDGQPLPKGDLHSRLEGGLGFIPEDRRHEGLMMDATVADNFALAALPLFASNSFTPLRRNSLVNAIRSVGQALKLRSGPLIHATVDTLSGGNQQKVILGRWLLRRPRLLILDEPTRGVDIGAREEIYRLLAGWASEGMSILMISSELEELLGLCHKIYVMHQGRIAARVSRPEFRREEILSAAFGQQTRS